MVAQQIASGFELGVEVIPGSAVLGQRARPQDEVCYVAVVVWANLFEGPSPLTAVVRQVVPSAVSAPGAV